LRGSASSIIRTERDVRVIRLDRRKILVVSCDSSGAIGSKALDQVKCPPSLVGRFAARVALMEVLATGSKPICVAAPLAVEPTPTGRSVLRGIRSEMEYAGLDSNIPIVDSAEKNFKTKQTSVGVTVVGLTNPSSLKIGRCVAGDEVFALGTQCVGAEVLSGERWQIIADPRDVSTLVGYGFIHEVIPVGSKGIIHEAEVMAKDSNLQFRPDNHKHDALTQSAGPATVILFASSTVRRVLTHLRKPITRIGSYAH
jgi:hypothetical protein